MTTQQRTKKLAWLDMLIRITLNLIDLYKDDEDWVRDYKPQNLSNIDAWLEERLLLMGSNNQTGL